ncbi:serine/threonine-protein kinase [Actinoplanes sp. NPDC049548]|uniref:serine/threonine-protein kinase n=1 Tax=Actinoplanes sp. NPDC049548 TaxID=3155152 RepID=UPI00341DF0CC
MSAVPPGVAGRYQLGESLGIGGMGQVWVARDEILDRRVAVKEIVLPADLVAAERDAVHRRMLQEARAAARLSHPNVAQVYDVFEDEGRAWIVMEYVPSRSLERVLREDGPLEPERVAVIGLELLGALEAAHRAGVRHRDVKPANVLLGPDGRVVLTDFGIASIEGDSVITTSSELVLGSPQYMSPERAKDGTAEPASDLWSLGATLYAAVEGRSPYQRPSAIGTLTALAADEPDPPRRAGPLQPVLNGLLRKDPAERTDIAETRRRLRAAAAVDPTGPVPAAGPAEAARRPGKIVLIAASALLVVLLVGAVVWLVTRPEARTRTATPVPSVAATQGRPAPSAPASATSPAPASAAAPAATTRVATSPARPTTAATGRTLPPRPAGWRDYRDRTGFALYVPEGWRRSREGTIVYFRDPATGRVLGIDQTDDPQWNPVADWRGKADYRVSKGDFPGYDEIHIREVRYFRKAADWEFTFDGSSSRQHVNNRGFVVDADQAYGIYWQTRDADWAATRDDLQLVFDSFRPAGG